MQTRLVLFSLACLCSSQLNAENARLDRIRHFHESRVNQGSKELIEALSATLLTSLEEGNAEMNSLLATLSGSLLRFASAVALDSPSQDATNYHDSLERLLDFEKRVQVYAQHVATFQDSLARTAARFEAAQAQFENLHSADVCQNTLDGLALILAQITYPNFDDIDLSEIPKPRFKGVSPIPGRADDDSDRELESDLMMGATSVGSSVGGGIGSVVPVIGTAIGAGIGFFVGAVVGYCAGKAAVATKVYIENEGMKDAYDRARDAERARQTYEIEETRWWILTHPITEFVVRAEASKFCSQGTWQLSLEEQSNRWTHIKSKVGLHLEAHQKRLQDMGANLQTAKTNVQSLKSAIESSGIEELTESLLTPITSDIDLIQQKRKILDMHQRSESTLFRCISDPNKPCTEKRICLEAVSEGLARHITLAIGEMSVELQRFQSTDWESRERIYANFVETCK